MNLITNVRRRLRLTEDRGVALVEFALVAPLLFVVLFGLIDFGKAINYWNTETQMAAQAARIASVNGGNAYSGTCLDGSTKATLTDYIQCQAGTNELRNGSSGVFGATAAEVCITPSGSGAISQPIAVAVKTHYTWIPLLNIAPITIKATATMRIERTWTGGSVGSTGATCP